jgi:hypothetical protein
MVTFPKLDGEPDCWVSGEGEGFRFPVSGFGEKERFPVSGFRFQETLGPWMWGVIAERIGSLLTLADAFRSFALHAFTGGRLVVLSLCRFDTMGRNSGLTCEAPDQVRGDRIVAPRR